LGILYKDLGRLDAAEKMYQRALQRKEKALGPDHESTLLTVNNLGTLYIDLGRLDEAEKTYKSRSVPNIINGIMFLESKIYLVPLIFKTRLIAA
jgi:tetratricopeptide (TPR) repeat protein